MTNLSADEKSTLPLPSDSNLSADDWAEGTLIDRFCVRSALRAKHTALATTRGNLTFEELYIFSRCIAAKLLERQSSGNRAICILLDQDEFVPAAILGVLMSGNFYVMLSSRYPFERNRFIRADSRSELIITSTRHLSLVRSLGLTSSCVLDIDKLNTGDAVPFLNKEIKSTDLAYLVYTSGSTGEPKGVMHTHRSVLHKTLRQCRNWNVTSNDRIGLLFGYHFGPASTNLFSALLSGATILPFNILDHSESRLLEWLAESRISIIHTVPTLFRHLTSTSQSDLTALPLRLIRIAGEPIFDKDIASFQEYFNKNCRLDVGLGCTETGVLFSNCFYSDSDCPQGVIPIGRPVSDIRIELVDRSGTAVNPGQPGEIRVRSRYLFSGYWNHPELTERVLTSAPDNPQERIFLTGDLGIELSGGRVKHIGRKDSRVKIRGHRVELQEIENVIRNVAGVQDTSIIELDQEGHGKRLAAYVVREHENILSAKDLTIALKKRLPDYMIPSTMNFIDAFPLTAGGKIDRIALQKLKPHEDTASQRAPRDFTETHLLAIWESLLRRSGFGIDDDFFDLGGDSLLAMKLSLQIEEVFGQPINLANFSTKLTIALLGRALNVTGQQDITITTTITPIQTEGTATPFFFCHGDYLSGGVFCRNLARLIGKNQPFFAIQPHGLNGDFLPTTITEMAADNITSLQTIQPEGPYRLGGFCWGGFVALEMARQLTEQGHEVKPLLLIDSDPKNIRLRPLRRFIKRFCKVFRLSQDTELALFRKCRLIVNAWQGAGSLGGKLRYLGLRLARPVKVLNLLLSPPKITNDRAGETHLLDSPVIREDPYERWRIYSDINQNHVPEPFPGLLVHFCSERLQKRHQEDPSKNWHRILPNVEVCPIPGDHWNCVTRHADVLSAKLRLYLSS